LKINKIKERKINLVDKKVIARATNKKRVRTREKKKLKDVETGRHTTEILKEAQRQEYCKPHRLRAIETRDI
jgi:hypothetical protein